jgi:hypothetical protein
MPREFEVNNVINRWVKVEIIQGYGTVKMGSNYDWGEVRSNRSTVGEVKLGAIEVL